MVGGRDGRPHAELFCVASFVRFWRDSSKLRQPILCTCEMRRPPLLLLLLHIYMYIVLLCRLTAQGLLLLLLLRTWFQSCQTYSHGATKKERARGAVADCAATWQRHLFFTNFSNQRFQSLFNATLFKYLGIPSNFIRKSLVCKRVELKSYLSLWWLKYIFWGNGYRYVVIK